VRIKSILRSKVTPLSKPEEMTYLNLRAYHEFSENTKNTTKQKTKTQLRLEIISETNGCTEIVGRNIGISERGTLQDLISQTRTQFQHSEAMAGKMISVPALPVPAFPESERLQTK